MGVPSALPTKTAYRGGVPTPKKSKQVENIGKYICNLKIVIAIIMILSINAKSVPISFSDEK